MKVLKHLTMLCAAGALGACSTVTPTIPFVPLVSGIATANADGTYTIVENGTTRELPASRTSPATDAVSLEFWFNVNEQGYTYTSADVTAVAVMDESTNITHAGISGTAAASVPTSGFATYTGAYSATYFRGGLINGPQNARGILTTDVDFGAGTLAGVSAPSIYSSLTVSGTISGTNFNGTANFSGTEYTGPATADLSGGFYGTNTLAGIYQSATVTGLIWGVTP